MKKKLLISIQFFRLVIAASGSIGHFIHNYTILSHILTDYFTLILLCIVPLFTSIINFLIGIGPFRAPSSFKIFQPVISILSATISIFPYVFIGGNQSFHLVRMNEITDYMLFISIITFIGIITMDIVIHYVIKIKIRP